MKSIRSTMPRPRCCRNIGTLPATRVFAPAGCCQQEGETLTLAFDELEALRLCDMQMLHQHQAAEEMGVSRQTIGRMLEEARKKVATAIIAGHTLKIEGGNYTMVETRAFTCASCGHRWELAFGTGRPQECPSCHGGTFHRGSASPEGQLPQAAGQVGQRGRCRRNGGQGKGRGCGNRGGRS
jgi:uncharacterized protein